MKPRDPQHLREDVIRQRLGAMHTDELVDLVRTGDDDEHRLAVAELVEIRPGWSEDDIPWLTAQRGTDDAEASRNGVD